MGKSLLLILSIISIQFLSFGKSQPTKLLSKLIHSLVLKGTSPVNKFIYISTRIFSYFHYDDLGEYLIDLVAAGKASDYHILSRFLPLTGLTADIHSPHYFIFYQCNCGYTFNT
jgi:hypothetical protein